MPALETDFVRTASSLTFSVALEPAANALNSLLLLIRAKNMSGYDAWVTETAASLTPEQWHQHNLVLIGLHYALTPQQRWSSFPAYLDHLANQDPLNLRNKILTAYESLSNWYHDDPPKPDWDQLMLHQDGYLDYLANIFPANEIDLALETEAYTYLQNPAELQKLLVSHLQEMWDTQLKAEWEKIKTRLEASVDAFQQVRLTGLTFPEAAERILGQELPEKWHKIAEGEEIEQIIFVPSTHLGPYMGTWHSKHIVWIFFGARLPEGSNVQSPELSRTELLVRINSLADDTRLQILQLLSQHEEMCSQDIMKALSLSQSAVSRHLKQLSATGYLVERRRESAKCYRLNPEQIENTAQAISSYLLGN